MFERVTSSIVSSDRCNIVEHVVSRHWNLSKYHARRWTEEWRVLMVENSLRPSWNHIPFHWQVINWRLCFCTNDKHSRCHFERGSSFVGGMSNNLHALGSTLPERVFVNRYFWLVKIWIGHIAMISKKRKWSLLHSSELFKSLLAKIGFWRWKTHTRAPRESISPCYLCTAVQGMRCCAFSSISSRSSACTALFHSSAIQSKGDRKTSEFDFKFILFT